MSHSLQPVQQNQDETEDNHIPDCVKAWRKVPQRFNIWVFEYPEILFQEEVFATHAVALENFKATASQYLGGVERHIHVRSSFWTKCERLSPPKERILQPPKEKIPQKSRQYKTEKLLGTQDA